MPNGQFVNALHEGDFANTTPYELRHSETVAFNTDYTVRSLRYKNWGADPGDFHVIEVLYHGNCIYTTKNAAGDEISLLNNSLYKLYIYHPRIYSWFNAPAAQILKLTQPKKK